MSVLQHYYTSYINEATGRIGFQVKAESPGISSEIEDTINRLISYTIPPSLNERDIDTHPVALRYFYEGPERCYLLCSQSCGSDSNGRPGNFFAHTLVLPPDMFTYMPPILFWKSLLWRREAADSRSPVDALPVLPSLDERYSSLNPDGVWDFLAQEGRRNLLYKLLCAIVHSKKTFQRVVILDTVENVVWWIASVTTLLPPAYRPLLSFATYHHDPKQGQYLITGTTSDSSFGVSSLDYRAFFVLNANTGETSEVADSPYAWLATQAAQPDLYDERLAPLFADYVRRFPAPTAIDEQLDLIALYARLHSARNDNALSTRELDAIHIALSSFEQGSEDPTQDIEELQYLQQVLAQSARFQQNSVIATERGRIEALLKKYAVQYGKTIKDELKSTGEQDKRVAENEQKTYIERNDRSARDELSERKVQNEPSVEDELKHFIENIFRQDGLDAVRFGQLQQRYNAETLEKAINQPEYLSWLIASLEHTSSQQMLSMWQTISKYIQPGAQSQPILILSLQKVGRLWDERRIDEGKVFLKDLCEAVKGNEQRWLQIAVANYHSLPHGLVELFYYGFVYSLKLEQREPYRNIIISVSDIVLNYEVVSDVSSVDVRQGLKVIETWVSYAQSRGYVIAPLVASGLSQLQKVCSPRQWRELAPIILRNTLLTPLPRNIEDQLVSLTFATFSLGTLSLDDLPLYERYQEHPALSTETCTMLTDILSLSQGHLDKTQAQRLYEQVKILTPEEYQVVVGQCIPFFFKNAVTKDAHQYLIKAFFTWNNRYDTSFWQIYWETFKGKLIDPSTASKFADMLAIWFNATSASLEKKYIVQYFFLTLSSHLEEIRKDRRFQEGIREFNKVASQRRNRWYPIVRDCFEEKKGPTKVAFFKIPQVFRRGESQDTDEKEEKRSQAFAREVGKLFQGNVLNRHSKLLVELYNTESRKLFWACYWQKFKEVMISGNAEPALTVLSFWFDWSFEDLYEAQYAPQEFFIYLPGVLEEVRGEEKRAFRETTHQIDENAAPHVRESYRWYPWWKHIL